MQCSAQHQAVRHHTKSTEGAARHAGCSGPMRPCVTARRRRQGSVGQVRECTGPAMPQHTYTQRAHNTHSPARLPLPVGRHPGLLPFGNSAFGTPHHNTPTALCPQLRCSRAHTVQCSAQHQAERHHTESTDGAARHARCSGPTRPCVTTHRRRQSNAGQVRVCSGPAMQQHTSTQRAHNTHSPTRLPVPVGRHPGLCLLVTAPSAQHITPHHNTTHRTAPQHTPAGTAACSCTSPFLQPPPEIGGLLTPPPSRPDKNFSTGPARPSGSTLADAPSSRPSAPSRT